MKLAAFLAALAFALLAAAEVPSADDPARYGAPPNPLNLAMTPDEARGVTSVIWPRGGTSWSVSFFQRDSGAPRFRDVVPFSRGRYGGHRMEKRHPVELRRRVVDHVAEGNTHRPTAARFKVSVKFVNDMVRPKAATGGLAPKAQGNGCGHGKLAALKDWIARRIGEKRDLTAAAVAAKILATHGVVDLTDDPVWRAVMNRYVASRVAQA